MSEPVQHIAYLVNLYPQVSHTFIRREILALEARGITVDRFSIRGWDDQLVDADDVEERKKTSYVLKDGLVPVLAALCRTALKTPGPFFRALKAAWKVSRNATKPLPYHLIWLAEACLIKDWMQESGATHLHAHFGTNPAEVAYFVHLLSGKPYSFTIHGHNEMEGAPRLHYDKKIAAAAFVAAVSSYCRSQIIRHLPLPLWDKLKVVHCGLSADYFREDVPPVPEDLRFLFVARIAPEKGHFILLTAFARLLEKIPTARLVLAGDGPSRAKVEAEIDRLKIGHAVEITSWVDAARIQSEIEKSTALVLPSFIEGLPVVIMEAMARGRPIVSTHIAGIPELVLPGKTGWLVPAGEAGLLHDAMLELAETDPATLTEMGRACIARVKERHLIDTEAAKLAKLMAGEPL